MAPRRLIAVGTLLVVATLAAYAPALRAGFIWDDDQFVTANVTLRSLAGLWRIWTEPGAVSQYYPLTFTTLWLEFRLWGLDAAGYHAVNVLLHCVNVLLLWTLLRRLEVPGAWLAAAIFAVHPLHAESVAWIAERKNVLSGAFYLGALLAYVRFRFGPKHALPAASHTGEAANGEWFYYGLALSLFACALLSKTVTASLPAAVLVLLWWKEGRVGARDVALLFPFFLLGIGFGAVTIGMERHRVGAQGPDWNFTPIERVLIAGRALWFYAGKLAWPYPLIFVYPRWNLDARAWWQLAFPIAAVAVLIGLFLARRRIGRGPLAAVLLFAGTLVPALGFFNVYPMRFSFVADHFAYLASIGLVALAAAGATAACAYFRLSETVWRGMIVVVLLVLGALTWRRTLVYRDLETLWLDTLAKNPDAWIAHNNLGVVLFEQHRVSEAMDRYREALRLKPDYSEAHNNLGNALFELGRTSGSSGGESWKEEAAGHYREAIALLPGNAKARTNLAGFLASHGDADEAIVHVREAIRAKPDYPEAHYTLGTIFMMQGRNSEAVAAYLEALRLRPDYAEAHNNLGVALFKEGRFDDAAIHYREAIRLAPAYPEAHYNLGLACARRGETDEAIAHYREALRLRPGYAEAHRDLGVALREEGKTEEAARHLDAAARLGAVETSSR